MKLQDWYRQLAERERRMVLWGGVAAAVLVVVGTTLQLGASVANAEERVQQRREDLAFIMDQISESFRGTSPALSRQELKQLLAAQILRGQWVRVFVRDIDVELRSPTEAHFRGKFIFGRSEADTLERLAAESRIQAYQVDGILHLEDGEWRFVSGGYRVIPPGQLF